MSLTQQDLAIRSQAIWSTESAAALGLSKYGTPISVWMEKTNQQLASANDEDGDETEDGDENNAEAKAMGLLLQPIIAKLYSQRTGEPLDDLEGLTMVSKDHPFLASHYDYRLSHNRRRLVECKSLHNIRRREFGEEGSDDVPMDILVQCLHEAYCHGDVDAVDVPVLFGGQKLEIFTVPITAGATDMLVSNLSTFWHEHVVKREPPAPQSDAEAKALWFRDNGREVIATEDVERACAQLAQIKAQLKQGEEVKDALTVQIKSALGEAALLRSRDLSRVLATWKSAKDGLHFDKKRFAEENPDLYARYCSMVPGSRRFLLK